MNPINPKDFRYIKLGRGGSWAQPAFERGELHLGYATVSHDLSLRGDWDAVTRFLTESGRTLGKARDAVREIRDFYTLGSDCLWITFAEGHLWWAIAEPEVTWLGVAENGQGARMRRTVDGWHRVNIQGEPLRIDDLSTRLTQVPPVGGGYTPPSCTSGIGCMGDAEVVLLSVASRSRLRCAKGPQVYLGAL